MIYSVLKPMPRDQSAQIKVEQFIDGEWIDVTNRCQLVDVTRGVALLIDCDERGGLQWDPVRREEKRSWVQGEFRASLR